MHLEAWAVEQSDADDDTANGLQTTVHPDLREDFEPLVSPEFLKGAKF